MEPFERMSLSELRHVLRVAARIHTRERAAEEEARLRAEYLRAAAEMGLTEEHLRQALAEIRRSRPHRIPHPLRRVAAVSLAGLFSVTGLVWWATRRDLAMAAVAEVAPVVTVAVVDPEPETDRRDRRGFTVRESGLKYRTLRAGNGAAAGSGAQVDVHYTAWLASDGARFDSTLDRGEVFTFQLGQGSCIPGFEEGIQGMMAGEKRRLVIPPRLGYGETGAPGAIPPDATLIFDVELVNIRNPEGM